MTRNLRALGIAVLAVFALLIGISTQASADELKSETSGSITLSGRQFFTNVFKTTGGSAECAFANLTGSVTTPANSITLTPEFTGCTCIGVACTIDMNSCDFRVNLGAGTFATMDIVCTTGTEITLTNSKCIIHIPSQLGFALVEVLNLGTGTTREVELAYSGIGVAYTHTAGTGIGKCTSGSGSGGSFTGSSFITASKSGSHIGLFAS